MSVSDINKGASGVNPTLENLGAVPLAGGIMTGPLILSGDPVNVLGAATKQYVDVLVDGSLREQGFWDASTNTPTLSDASGTQGYYYVVSVAGTQNLGSGSQTFSIGDWVYYNSNNQWEIFETGVAYTPENAANKSTDGTMAADSATLYPSQSAVVTYASAKVADSITDGVTTIAPSQNAVFDALALKQNTGSVNLPTGTCLKVVSTTKNDTASTTSSTYAAITGLSATITPVNSSSDILVQVVLSVGGANLTKGNFQLFRGTTQIAGGSAPGVRISDSAVFVSAGATSINSVVIQFLDFPATGSAVVYSVKWSSPDNVSTVYLNRASTDTSSALISRTISTITLQEFKG